MKSIARFISTLLLFRVTVLGFFIPRQVGTRVRIRTGVGGEGKESNSPTAGELSSVDFYWIGLVWFGLVWFGLGNFFAVQCVVTCTWN